MRWVAPILVALIVATVPPSAFAGDPPVPTSDPPIPAVENPEATIRSHDPVVTASDRMRLARTQQSLLHEFLTAARGTGKAGEIAAYERVLDWKSRLLPSLSETRSPGPTRSGRESVSVAALARALPPGSALVDFLVHPVARPGDRPDEREDGEEIGHGSWNEPRISAWVLRAETGSSTTESAEDDATADVQLGWVDLGEAARVEVAIQEFLANVVISRGVSFGKRISLPMSNDRVRSLLWDPIAEHVGDAETVFLSPDSFVGHLPFEILARNGSHYLIEDHAFVYLRDAASLVFMDSEASNENARNSGGLLCVGDVDYRTRGVGSPAIGAGTESESESDPDSGAQRTILRSFTGRWYPLARTRYEATAVAKLHEQAFETEPREVLVGSAATEERVKYEMPRHRVLHLATHGFLEPRNLPSLWEAARDSKGATPPAMRDEERTLTGLLPSSMSGLVLAGAGRPPHDTGRDDGYLTAEELSRLDLSGGDLVVLSACETGLGHARSADGLAPVRRALREAGARTVISSLWQVSDEVATDLMRSFYRRLWIDGETKLDALRGARLDVLKRYRIELQGDALPKDWGAFVLDGDWR